MPVRLDWSDEAQTVLKFTFEGRWTWEEYYPLHLQAFAIAQDGARRIDVIVDLLNSDALPANTLTHAVKLAGSHPPNHGVSVVVTTNRVVRALHEVGVRLNVRVANFFFIVDSLEEAQDVIAAARQNNQDSRSA